MIFRQSVQNAASLFLCLFLGLALQVQTSIGESSDSFGLRINLGDLALPFAGILVLLTLGLKKSIWPAWLGRWGLIGPILLTAWVIISFVHGRFAIGDWDQWALINKFLGWFILMGYFGFGAWLSTNLGNRAIRLFLTSFMATFLVIAIGHLLILVVTNTPLSDQSHYVLYQLKGLMGNRNAFGLLLLIALSILSVYTLTARPLFHNSVTYTLWALLPAMLIYNGSRATMLGLVAICLLIILIYKIAALRLIFIALISGVVLIASLLSINSTLVFREMQDQRFVQMVESVQDGDAKKFEQSDLRNYWGDAQRIRFTTDAISFWKDSPIFGLGLGTFLHLQAEKYAGENQLTLGIIDSTPLWILTEMGLIGLILFGAYYGTSLYTLSRSKGPTHTDTDALRNALILILVGFGIMSIFHELLYSRIIWFMLGLGLARSYEERSVH